MAPMGSSAFREKLESLRLGTPHKDKTKVVRDELGNDTIHHGDGRQDINIRAPRAVLVGHQKEERHA